MDFAFLIHSRDHRDIRKKFKFLKIFPKFIIELICFIMPPMFVSRLFIDEEKNRKTGALIGIPMTAKQMLKYRNRARKQIIKACAKAERKGAKIIGLGALTSTVTDGGKDLHGKVKLKVTNGNAFTVVVAHEHIKKILDSQEIKRIAVVGATGSTGQGVMKLLARDFKDKEYALYARSENTMKELVNYLRKNSVNNISAYLSDLSSLNQAELIIVATSSSNALLHSEHLKQGAIVYDMTQPQNIDKETLKNRKDLTIYDGGLVFAGNLEGKLPFGLPPKVIFACLGETILLSLDNYSEDFTLGKVDLPQIDYIEKSAKKHKLKPVSLEI